ncbi:MAG: ABC transporter permease [Phycisphaeraceae bacterium]|nr:ABC transporter permease [Phycisphaeraceae bacterium]
MLPYILRRLVLMFPTLIGVTAVVFFTMALAPGGFQGETEGEAGARTEGTDPRFIRNYYNRRYGLDQPAVVQYLRWLNLISPVGFATSNDVEYTPEQRDAAQALIDGWEPLRTRTNRRRADAIFTFMGQYLDRDIVELTEESLPLLTDEDRILELFDRMDITMHRTSERFNERRRQLKEAEDHAALLSFQLTELELEAAGRARLLLERGPRLKWPSLGETLGREPVIDRIARALPVTLLLNVIAVPLTYFLASISGIYAGRRRGGLFDRGSGTTFIILWSLPTVWVGVMMISFLANKDYLNWFPLAGLSSPEAADWPMLPRWGGEEGFVRGWLLDRLWHMTLPVLCLSYGGLAVLSKVARGAVLENISADYARTARAKGVSEHDVLFRHVLKNSLLPLITVFASLLPALFVGSVVVERIFSIPGMGYMGIEAAFAKDRDLILGTTLIASILGLSVSLARDILYAIVDPRVSYE